jgi:hypothetical protein
VPFASQLSPISVTQPILAAATGTKRKHHDSTVFDFDLDIDMMGLITIGPFQLTRQQ